MKIRVLGSFGSRLPGFNTSSLLLDGRLLLDAGTVTAILSLEQQANIDDVLLTHGHLDHMVDLAFLVDNVLTLRDTPLRVWGPTPVLETVSRHLFNGEVWPDFSRLPSPDRPALCFCPLNEDEVTEISGYQIQWVRTNHPVYTAGYLLRGAEGSILFSGDTTTTEAVWQMGHDADDLLMAFIETSFPDRLDGLARASGHLTPSLLGEELTKFNRPDVPVKIFHVKPQFLSEVEAELATLSDARLSLLQGGETFDFTSSMCAAR
jgi:ribonuclease BN (tRNA processing enzyme)